MVDHSIRVHPEQGVKSPGSSPALRTKVRPRELYLRLIVADSRESADSAYSELGKGVSFFDVAQKYSRDPSSALAGGYIGEMQPDKMDSRLGEAALKLDRGAYSPVLDVGGKYMLVERLPRDFLYDAIQLEIAGSKLRLSGKLDQAADAYTRALRVYPRFLRALVFLGVTFGQQGNAQRAAGVLQYAARLYPEDPAAQYNLGIAYESLGRADEAIAAYGKAVQLQTDLIPAFLNLGSALYQQGRLDEAARAYEAGLQGNPLTASLYHNLAAIYEQQGKIAEAKHAAAVAAKLGAAY